MGDNRRVLVVDNDRDIADVVETILTDAGFTVSVLTDVGSAALRLRANQYEPGCVLLDGQGPGLYGESWVDAAWLHEHQPTAATVMFTADQLAAEEARELLTARSKLAAFDIVLMKPFDIDELLDAVALAVKKRA